LHPLSKVTRTWTFCSSSNYQTLHHTTLSYTRYYATLSTAITTSTTTAQLCYATTTTRTALHHTTSSSCVEVATATIAATPKTQLQPPVGPSVDSLCHPWFTTTNLSYRFPFLKFPPPPCTVILVKIINHFFRSSVFFLHIRVQFPLLWGVQSSPVWYWTAWELTAMSQQVKTKYYRATYWMPP
jgi:hypothetical protein